MRRYRGRISGPLLDRIDLHVEVNRPSRATINGHGQAPENSCMVRNRVVAARRIQLERAGIPNAQLNNAQAREFCGLSPILENLLETVAERMCLSPRACQRIQKVARTLADLDAEQEIAEQHLAEAVMYRGIDPTVD
jgi:magnesium chelatase family protein